MVRVIGHKVQVTAVETVEMKVKCSIIKLVILFFLFLFYLKSSKQIYNVALHM